MLLMVAIYQENGARYHAFDLSLLTSDAARVYDARRFASILPML